MNCLIASVREIFNDGVMRATAIEQMVHLEWLNNDCGYLCKQVVKDLFKVERMIEADPNLKGWMCGSERENTEMHKILEKVGGRQCLRDKKSIWFSKLLKKEPLCAIQ